MKIHCSILIKIGNLYYCYNFVQLKMPTERHGVVISIFFSVLLGLQSIWPTSGGRHWQSDRIKNNQWKFDPGGGKVKISLGIPTKSQNKCRSKSQLV